MRLRTSPYQGETKNISQRSLIRSTPGPLYSALCDSAAHSKAIGHRTEIGITPGRPVELLDGQF